MTWIQLDTTLFTHQKIIVAAEALDLPEVHVVGHLAALWSWAMDHAGDGILPASSRVIARAAQYDGDAQAFVGVLVGVGLLDDRNGAYAIHDWVDYSGKLHVARTANAERMRAARAASSTPDPAPTAPAPRPRRQRTPTPASVPDLSPVLPDNIPYAMWQLWIDASGQDESEASPSYKSKQLGFAKRIQTDGFTPDDVARCFDYLQTDPFWSAKGIDLQVIHGQIGKWAMAGRPVAVPTPITRAATGRAADVRAGVNRLRELGS